MNKRQREKRDKKIDKLINFNQIQMVKMIKGEEVIDHGFGTSIYNDFEKSFLKSLKASYNLPDHSDSEERERTPDVS